MYGPHHVLSTTKCLALSLCGRNEQGKVVSFAAWTQDDSDSLKRVGVFHRAFPNSSGAQVQMLLWVTFALLSAELGEARYVGRVAQGIGRRLRPQQPHDAAPAKIPQGQGFGIVPTGTNKEDVAVRIPLHSEDSAIQGPVGLHLQPNYSLMYTSFGRSISVRILQKASLWVTAATSSPSEQVAHETRQHLSETPFLA